MSNIKSIKGSDLAQQIADSEHIMVVRLLEGTKATVNSIPRDSIDVQDKYITLPLKGEGTTGLDDGTDTSCSFSTHHLATAQRLGKNFYRLVSCGCEYIFFTNQEAE